MRKIALGSLSTRASERYSPVGESDRLMQITAKADAGPRTGKRAG